MAACKKYLGKDFGLLMLRLALGVLFVYQGYGKLTGIEGTTGFFDSLGIPAAGVMAYAVALVEFLGGIMLILGVFTCYTAGVLAIVMIVALLTAHLGQPFRGSLLALTALGGLAALSSIGGGRWSLLKNGCCGGSCEGNCGPEDKDTCGCGGNCGCGKKDMPADMKK